MSKSSLCFDPKRRPPMGAPPGKTTNPTAAFLHRYLWQRLPYALRRKLLLKVSLAAAPRINPHALPSSPIIVVGTFRTASGLGESARLCYLALRKTGFRVLGIDITALLMQTKDLDFKLKEGGSSYGAGTLVIHANGPLIPSVLAYLSNLVREKYVIGYWAWELPSTPNEWRPAINLLHEIWVPSTFVADAIRPIAGSLPIRVIPHSIIIEPNQFVKRNFPDHRTNFRVLTIYNAASSIARKNPLASVKAFQTAFGHDPTTQLTLKSLNGGIFRDGENDLWKCIKGYSNIDILDEVLEFPRLQELYLESDVFLSLHRAEGFGLSLVEAMLYGLPVIATNWSGNVDYLDKSNGFPIPFKLVPARDPQMTYNHPEMNWAEADIGSAAAALRLLRDNPVLRTTIGARASTFAHTMYGVTAYAANVVAALGARPEAREEVLIG